MEIITGKVSGISEDGTIIIIGRVPSIERANLRQYATSEVQIGLPDGRTISPEQRKKAHVLIGEIADWVGDFPESMKKIMKMEFISCRMAALEKNIFSLSNCDVTTAKEFISFLIDFMIEHGVPSKVPLWKQCEDINRYVFACLINKRCVVCGKHAELHHVDRIGGGYNRKTKYQIGDRVLSLCRVHHEEVHHYGEAEFLKRYYLVSIELTREIGKVYKLTKKALGEA